MERRDFLQIVGLALVDGAVGLGPNDSVGVATKAANIVRPNTGVGPQWVVHVKYRALDHESIRTLVCSGKET